MARFRNYALRALSICLVLFTLLLGYYYVFTGLITIHPHLIVALSLLCCALLAITAFAGERIKARVLYLAYLLLILEFGLQILFLSGRVAPFGIWDYSPYGRFYNTIEGHANSINNRYGWYARKFRLAKDSRKIALIGDSFIQAGGINKEDHMAYALERLLNRGAGLPVEVLPLGMSGNCPAQYLEMLEYADTYLHAREAVIFITTVNDFRNSSYERQPDYPAKLYIYYALDKDGRLQLDPGSRIARYRFRREFELAHKSLFFNLGRTVRSHIILEKLARTLRDVIEARRSKGAAPVRSGDFAELLISQGVDMPVYHVPLSPEARRSVDIAAGVLQKCSEYAKARGMRLHLVAIPYFPQRFYAEKKGGDWSSKIGEYDFFQPERILAEFARKNGIPLLPAGKYMRRKGLLPAEIRRLYLSNGSGHFSPEGHRFFAEALRDQFHL